MLVIVKLLTPSGLKNLFAMCSVKPNVEASPTAAGSGKEKIKVNKKLDCKQALHLGDIIKSRQERRHESS